MSNKYLAREDHISRHTYNHEAKRCGCGDSVDFRQHGRHLVEVALDAASDLLDRLPNPPGEDYNKAYYDGHEAGYNEGYTDGYKRGEYQGKLAARAERTKA